MYSINCGTTDQSKYIKLLTLFHNSRYNSHNRLSCFVADYLGVKKTD
jgi:hypothetical protein